MLIKDVQNSIMYFSATIFSLLGFTSPILTSLSVAVTNFVFTLLALLIIDRVGRRAILLRSIPVMIAGLVLCSVSVRILLATLSQIPLNPWLNDTFKNGTQPRKTLSSKEIHNRPLLGFTKTR